MSSEERPLDQLFVTGGGLLGGARPEQALIGLRLGAFELVDIIGRGGMSTVYLAERRDEAFEQRAAVKVLNHVSEALVARFQQERQILARLDHPAIARIYDGGTLEDGRPYLVMEYVAGDPIDRYCQQQDASLDRRLDLFEQVADAVRVAHAESIVHYDLKPDNVLVDRHGHVKLLDFGIARLLTDRADAAPTALMTPRYAAPEQFAGQPAGVATDLFQLGLLLYGLATGRQAADTADSTQALERVATRLPIIPASQTRGPQQRRLDRDLDAIIAQSLKANPTDRYGSVAALLTDLRAWRHGRSTSVGATAVRLFLRRHRTAVAAILLGAGALTLVSLQLYDNYQRERARSQAMSEFASSVLDSGEEGIDQISNSSFEIREGAIADDPELERELTLLHAEALMRNGRPQEVVTLVEAVLARSMGGFETRPADAPLYAVLGTAYRELGNPERAGRHLGTAIDMGASTLSPRQLAEVYEQRAALEIQRGDPGAALQELEQALALPLAEHAALKARLAAAHAMVSNRSCPADSANGDAARAWLQWCDSAQQLDASSSGAAR